MDIEDGLAEPYPLVEGVEGKVLDEPDAAHLELVDLGPELHRFFLLAPDDRPDVRPVQAGDAARGPHAVVEEGVLLLPYLLGRRPAYILVHGKGGKPVLFFPAVQFKGELFVQQEQGPGQCTPLLLGLPSHLAVGHVPLFPLQVPAPRHCGLFLPAHFFEQPLQLVGAFPEQLCVGGVPHMALVARGVHGGGVLSLDVRRPVPVEDLLQGVDVELSRQFRPDLADDLEVFQAIGTDIDASEELPVQVAVQPFDEFPVGAVGIVLQEHKGDLAPGGENGQGAFFGLLQPKGKY